MFGPKTWGAHYTWQNMVFALLPHWPKFPHRVSIQVFLGLLLFRQLPGESDLKQQCQQHSPPPFVFQPCRPTWGCGLGMSLLKGTAREHFMVSSLRDNRGRKHDPGPFVSTSDVKEKGRVLQRAASSAANVKLPPQIADEALSAVYKSSLDGGNHPG